jgi:hypothetical protein
LNGYPLKLSSEDTSILSDFRKYLTRQIDKTFRFLSAQINKDWPATGAGNPKETTDYLARTCHIFIGILVDSYGFTDETGLSATVVELDAAYQDSPEKMLIFIQHTLRDTTSEIYQKLPKPYQTWLTDLQNYRSGKVVKFFNTWEELPGLVLSSLDRYGADTLRAIRRMPAYASNKSDEEMDWEQMTFRERHSKMLASFNQSLAGITLHHSAFDSLSHLPTEEDGERYQLVVRLAETTHQLPIILSVAPTASPMQMPPHMSAIRFALGCNPGMIR